MNRSLGVRFGLAVFLLVWLPLIATVGSGTYWLWLRTQGRPSTALQSLALQSDALKLADAAKDLSETLDRFLLERINEVKSWAEAPAVLAAARKVHAAHAKEGLDKLSVAQIESKFRIRKSLGLAPEARAYLSEQIRLSPYFGEVFFTDTMGFNVALTSPTTDFVQSDENWWQQAWSSGFFVGDIEFDASSNLWAIEIAAVIRDKGTGQSLGIMKAVLALRFAQQFSDRVARRLSQPGQLLHTQYAASPDGVASANRGAPQPLNTHFLVVSRDGTLIAETRSSHARGRIMQPEVNVLTNPSLAHLTASYEGDRSGSFIAARARQGVSDVSQDGVSESYLVAFARTAGASFFAPVVGNFPGFDWMIIAETRNLGGLAELPGDASSPTDGQRSLGQGLTWLGVAFFGALSLSSILLCWLFGRWVVKPVLAMTNHVERMEQGRIGATVAVAAKGEMADLASALDRVRAMIVRMADHLQQTAAARPGRQAPADAPAKPKEPGTS